ncbi:MAG: 2-amino-4-hydroxy-6-hydroxymethyldihydropteridine diphosphokinase [Candidatus Omnitrophica bacterium]|nr:2-amino-4-hydroxy-6-hydroxymethyldihydropteridine diphosphokinase [Candidatus Omnitrophota bacterium]
MALHDCFIALGSNLGDREENLRTAVEKLRLLPSTRLLKISAWLENEPVGGPTGQGRYLNGVVHLQTELSPQELMKSLQRIEAEMGRPSRRIRWGPRIIDLDLLSCGDIVLTSPNLNLPHPRLHERPFVLAPLAEIEPAWLHPLFQKTAVQLLNDLSCRSSGG